MGACDHIFVCSEIAKQNALQCLFVKSLPWINGAFSADRMARKGQAHAVAILDPGDTGVECLLKTDIAFYGEVWRFYISAFRSDIASHFYVATPGPFAEMRVASDRFCNSSTGSTLWLRSFRAQHSTRRPLTRAG